MKPKLPPALQVVILVAISGFVILTLSQLVNRFSSPQSLGNQSQVLLSPLPTPIVELGPEQAIQAYLSATVPVIGEQPRVILKKEGLRYADYPALGLGKYEPPVDAVDNPLVLMLFEGGFDLPNIPSQLSAKDAARLPKPRYVCIVYDVKRRGVAYLLASPGAQEMEALLRMAEAEDSVTPVQR